jgi:putative redox protein
MKVFLKRVNPPFHLIAENENGNTVAIDASQSIGGTNAGVRPMELLLMGLGSCSSIDVISILNKQRQTIEDFQVEIDGERDTGKEANVFTKIQVHFKVNGQVEKEKLEHAISLSMEKYCSVAKILEKTSTITHTYSLNETN